MKNKSWSFYIVICLSLGLAPWWLNGEPHIIGKIKWILGGAEGMAFMDWFDVVLHATPWGLLIWKAYYEFVLKKKKNQ